MKGEPRRHERLAWAAADQRRAEQAAALDSLAEVLTDTIGRIRCHPCLCGAGGEAGVRKLCRRCLLLRMP